MSITTRAWLCAVTFLFAINLLTAQYTPEELQRRADKQFDLHAYNLALSSYQALVEYDANNTHAVTRIGDCYTHLNKPEDALTWYDKATTQTDAKPDALRNYGLALMSVQNYTVAKRWFTFYAEHNKSVATHYIAMCDYATANAEKKALYEVKNELLNTAASDFGAAYLGKQIVYSSSRSDLKRKDAKTNADWSGNAYNQLYITQLDAKTGQLQKPAFLKSELANAYNEGPVTFSADGKKVFYSKNSFVDGTRQMSSFGTNTSLFFAKVEEGNWYESKAFPYNASEYSISFPSLSPDGNSLYFASNMPGGEGGWDIYECRFDGKSWSNPENAGKNVNSEGDEITPYFDGGDLYFASNWHLGFGGFDIFKATGSNEKWTKVLHLGPGINSARDDYGFIYNPANNTGYLTSNRTEGKGNEDIWKVTKQIDDFTIAITDAKGKAIGEAVIDFTACGGDKFKTNEAGIYEFAVKAGQADCEANISKSGFHASEILVKSSGAKTLSVVLESENIAYFIGKINDFAQKTPIEGVTVRALPMPKGDVVQTVSDKDGLYTLALEAQKTYKLQYAKEGYVDNLEALQTGKAKLKNDISPVVLTDEKTVLEKKDSPATAGTSAPQTPMPVAPAPVTHDLEKPKTSATPPAAKTGETETPVLSTLQTDEKVAGGFSIQLSSQPGNTVPAKLDKYDDVKKYGNVYSQPSGKSTKIRLGIYEDKNEALAVLDKVKKMSNYRGAFLVPEKSADANLVIKTKSKTDDQKKTEVAKGEVKPTENEAKKPENGKETAAAVRFAVQVASLQNDETVSLSPFVGISEMGNLYTKPEDNMTKVRIGIWENYADSKAAKAQIAAKGFKDAMIVPEEANPATDRFIIMKKAEPKKAEPKKEEPKKEEPKKEVEKPTAKTPTQTPKGEAKTEKPTEHSTPKAADKTSAAPVKASPYKIRVASYVDPKNFDTSRLNGIAGKMETTKSGKFTVFLMAGYTDLEAAIKAKNDLREQKGFLDCYIVKEEKGKLVKVEL